MLNILIDASIIAIVGVVWVLMLVRNGEILEFIPVWFQKHVTANRPKLHKVLFQCEKCAAGQLALWGYFLNLRKNDWHYNPFDHFLLIVLAIFMARVTGGWISKNFG